MGLNRLNWKPKDENKHIVKLRISTGDDEHGYSVVI